MRLVGPKEFLREVCEDLTVVLVVLLLATGLGLFTERAKNAPPVPPQQTQTK